MGIFGSETLPKIPKPLISPASTWVRRLALRTPGPDTLVQALTRAGAGRSGKRAWGWIGQQHNKSPLFNEKII